MSILKYPLMTVYKKTIHQTKNVCPLEITSLVVVVERFHSITPSLLRSFAPLLLRSFAPSLLHYFPPSLLRSFAPSLLHSFVPSLLHSFTPSLLPSFPPSLLHISQNFYRVYFTAFENIKVL